MPCSEFLNGPRIIRCCMYGTNRICVVSRVTGIWRGWSLVLSLVLSLILSLILNLILNLISFSSHRGRRRVANVETFPVDSLLPLEPEPCCDG